MKSVPLIKTIINAVNWVLKGHSATAATLQTLITKVLIIGINVATGVITARSLGAEGRGELAAIGLGPQFLGYAMTLGLPAALLYNFKRHPEKKSELLGAAVVISAVLGVLATLTGIVFLPQWLSKYSAQTIFFAQLFMLSAPLNIISAVFVSALEAESNFTASNQVAYLAPLMTLGILGGLSAAKAVTPFTAALAYLIPNVPLFVWMGLILWKKIQPSWRNVGKSSKLLLSYGIRAYGIDLIGTLSAQVDQALVVNLLSPAAMGMYTVALNLSRMLYVLGDSINKVLFPKTAARPVQEVVDITGVVVRISTVLTLLAAIAVMLLGPILLSLLYGSDFIGALPVLRILVIQVVIAGVNWTLAKAFMSLGRPGVVTLFQGIGLGLSVPIMLVLIPLYGLEGAGWGLLGSTVARLVFVLACYPLILKVRPPGLIVTKRDMKFLFEKLNFRM